MQSQSSRQPAETSHQNLINDAKLILSVDDDQALLYTRQAILEQAGYEVMSAKDGLEALALFGAHPIDLVLLDYVMPKLYGCVVATEMKRRKSYVPIIIVSEHESLPKALIPADMFIFKSDGPAYLLGQIENFLASISTLKRSA